MKLQDQHPYDETLLGLDNLYCPVGADSLYINSDCIRVTNRTITIGKTYLLVDCPEGEGIELSIVQLLDGYYKEGIVHLFLEDIQTHRVLTLDLCIECLKTHCRGLLVDSQNFNDVLDALAIKSYCEKCSESKNESTTDVKPKQKHDDDLLEFDF